MRLSSTYSLRSHILEQNSIPVATRDATSTRSSGYLQRLVRFGLATLLLLITATATFAQQAVIHEIVPHGNRRIPADTIKSRMFTRAGDVYDENALERDFNSLWNTGYFDDIRFEREDTTKGVVIHVYVHEKPTIREIKYVGLNSASQSDVLDRFKERKVQLTQESQYDPTRVKKAEVVLKELLSERGRQFANIRTEVRPIPPAAVAVTFIIKEGPKLKVGKIAFEGNKKLGKRYLRAAMKNLKPIGIPKSIFFENLFARTYNATKLNEDAERVRYAYQQKGYYKALVGDPKTQIRDTHHIFHVPLVQKGSGKVVDITIPIEEGDRYRLKEITFSGNKAISNTKALRAQFLMKDGDIFDVEKVRKGLDGLRKVYGEFGYINFTPVPDTRIDDDKKLITLAIDLDEGKPFYVRRIEFTGNTTTRDKVIRRELAVEEGQVYNSRLWELSLLRLNQLQYFNELKPDQDSEVKQNNQEGTVDITLKVKEKGKNSIGLTGGVSGLAGSFIGINYETNNFLGLGETLRVEANIGSRERNLLFGFTEPYMFDRPLQVGFTIFTRKFNFNEAEQNAILTGQNLGNVPQAVLNQLQNYSQNTTGFTLSGSYPIRRSFRRVGLTYSFDNTSIQTFSTASQQLFQTLAFRGISGPNALQGIKTSKLTPSFSWNTIDNPQRPHSGKSLFLAADFAGVGGNVKEIRPVMEFKHWIPMHYLKPSKPLDGRQSFGYRIQASFLTGYGGIVAPPFDRFYTGGDTDVRGFDIRSITPYAYITNKVDFALINPGDPCLQFAVLCAGIPKDPNNPLRGVISSSLPIQQLVFTGGDTSLITNLEYRIPIAGPVALAVFTDFGLNMALRQSQLHLSNVEVSDLNGAQFGCPFFNPVTFQCEGSFTQKFSGDLKPVPGTNIVPRMSSGLEIQALMPIINAPVRIYWAYNPLRLDTTTSPSLPITRSMFPPGGAGDISFARVQQQFAPSFTLREPRKTFRFTVATTF
jgi:outer membrane protein insertion porin family